MGLNTIKKETVREFIDKRSHGAYVSFDFKLDDKENKTIFESFGCISVEDFLIQYGRRSDFILDEYVVVDTQESCPSVDQGQTIWMTLQRRSEYSKTLKPVKLSPLDAIDIISKLEDIKKAKENIRVCLKSNNITKCDLSSLDYVDFIIEKLNESYEGS